MNVLLYRVGRNLARAVRTSASFGVARIELLDCKGAAVRGPLHGAGGVVEVVPVDAFPAPSRALALETGTGETIDAVDWTRVEVLLLGGETGGLPRRVVRDAAQRATIPTAGWACLTVEAALAIALYLRQGAMRNDGRDP